MAAKSKDTDTSKVLLWKEIQVDVPYSAEIHTIPYTNQRCKKHTILLSLFLCTSEFHPFAAAAAKGNAVEAAGSRFEIWNILTFWFGGKRFLTRGDLGIVVDRRQQVEYVVIFESRQMTRGTVVKSFQLLFQSGRCGHQNSNLSVSDGGVNNTPSMTTHLLWVLKGVVWISSYTSLTLFHPDTTLDNDDT